VARPLVATDAAAVLARLAAPAPLAPVGIARPPGVVVARPVALAAALAPPAGLAVVAHGIPTCAIAVLSSVAAATLRGALAPAVPAAVFTSLARDFAALAPLALL
jgi:hypothetical protein